MDPPESRGPDTAQTPESENLRPRVRVTRACDRCKKRKIRCTGLAPCRFCVQAGTECAFTAAYNRRPGRRRWQRQALDAPHDTAAATNIGNPDATAVSNGNASNRTPHNSAAVASSPSLHSERSASATLHGDYVGPASGVSFLLNAQEGLIPLPSATSSSSFSFSDLQMHCEDDDAGGCLVIAREEINRLLALHFDFTVPMDRFLHRPSVESWCDEFWTTSGIMERRDNHAMRRALLHIMFALAQQHASAKPSDLNHRLSVRYFLAADRALTRERGPACLLSVQIRLMQCLWLLSESRVNHCWSLFGTTARIALAIGIHRFQEPRRMANHIDLECRRRTFWSAYSLDNYLSTALGRSRIFHDEDIDQALPSCVDDNDISADGIRQVANTSQTLTAATVAYFKLGKIISKILHDLYSARRLSHMERVKFAQTHAMELRTWRTELPSSLDVDGANTSMLIPIFQRQKNVLTLAYHHTTILTHRQLLLDVGSTDSSHDGGLESQQRASVQECLQAAAHIIDYVNNLVLSGQMFRAYWFTAYFTFSALVVIYVYVVKCCCRIGPIEFDLEAATRCHDCLSSIDDKGSLIERYCLVLERLRRAAMNHVKTHDDFPRDEHPLPDYPSIRGGYTNMVSPSRSTTYQAGGVSQELGSYDSSLNAIFNVDGSPTTMYDFSGHFSSMFAGGGTGLEDSLFLATQTLEAENDSTQHTGLPKTQRSQSPFTPLTTYNRPPLPAQLSPNIEINKAPFPHAGFCPMTVPSPLEQESMINPAPLATSLQEVDTVTASEGGNVDMPMMTVDPHSLKSTAEAPATQFWSKAASSLLHWAASADCLYPMSARYRNGSGTDLIQVRIPSFDAE